MAAEKFKKAYGVVRTRLGSDLDGRAASKAENDALLARVEEILHVDRRLRFNELNVINVEFLLLIVAAVLGNSIYDALGGGVDDRTLWAVGAGFILTPVLLAALRRDLRRIDANMNSLANLAREPQAVGRDVSQILTELGAMRELVASLGPTDTEDVSADADTSTAETRASAAPEVDVVDDQEVAGTRPPPPTAG